MPSLSPVTTSLLALAEVVVVDDVFFGIQHGLFSSIQWKLLHANITSKSWDNNSILVGTFLSFFLFSAASSCVVNGFHKRQIEGKC